MPFFSVRLLLVFPVGFCTRPPYFWQRLPMNGTSGIWRTAIIRSLTVSDLQCFTKSRNEASRSRWPTIMVKSNMKIRDSAHPYWQPLERVLVTGLWELEACGGRVDYGDLPGGMLDSGFWAGVFFEALESCVTLSWKNDLAPTYKHERNCDVVSKLQGSIPFIAKENQVSDFTLSIPSSDELCTVNQ